MKLNVIKQALEMFEARGGHDDDTQTDIANCWIELAEMEKAYASNWPSCDDVTTIPASLMIDFGNEMWYNVYGRKARQVGHDNMTVEHFVDAIRNEAYCSEVSRVVIEDVYYFLHDLWLDNESDNSNRRDGSFCQYLADDDYELIQDILCDKLDEGCCGEQYEATMQAKRRLTAMFQDKWTTY